MVDEIDFYYSANGNRVPLRESGDTLAITYQQEVQAKNLEALIRGDDELAKFVSSPELQSRNIVLYKRSPAAKIDMDVFAARVIQSDLIAYVSPVYYRGETPLVVTNEFITAFKTGIALQEIEQLNATNNVEILNKFDFAPNTYLLRVERPGMRGALNMANHYFETGLADYSEPNFIYIMELKAPFVPNDPLFPNQWHLPRIRASEAWEITRGDPSVIIAVVDDGVDLDHEDFASPGKIVAGFDFLGADPNPRPGPGDDHGTAVAGVATADGNNAIGVTGIAPNSRLMAIRLVGTAQTAVMEAAAFRFAADNGAAIISNSWGPSDGGGAAPLPGIVRAAIDYATNTGRGGKGCVIFFAAGNGNESISAPATLDGYASYNRVIAVGASNDLDVRSGYSDFGPEIGICAPSDGTSAQPLLWTGFPADGSTRAIFTTDRMGAAGYNPPPVGIPIDPEPAVGAINYTGTFGGTSSAAPLAAGVAALILSVAADLTRRQVRYILEATGDKIDSANVNAIGRYQPNGHSQWYGFGRVNAFEAVKGARSSVPDRDFIHRVTVTLRRTTGDRFVSTKVVQAIDARQNRTETATNIFVRGGPDGFLRAELSAVFDEVEVDE